MALLANKSVIRAAPIASLEEEKTWRAAEMATWRKITSEVKCELADWL